MISIKYHLYTNVLIENDYKQVKSQRALPTNKQQIAFRLANFTIAIKIIDLLDRSIYLSS